MRAFLDSFGDDRGISAIWVAFVAVFLMAAGALAVDTSGGFQTARTDQNTADLSCLAGVPELPDINAGIDLAVQYAVDNWPTMAGHTTSFAGTTGTYSDDAGNEIYVDAEYGGDPSKMYVRVTEVGEAYFSKAMGNQSIPVTQEAWCRADVLSSGGGSLPFGALPDGFQGGLQAPNPCGTNSGNCGALQIPRDDVGGTSNQLIKNIAEGSDRDLTEWLGNQAGSVHCDSINAGDVCHKVQTDTGVSAAHLGEGFLQRFEDDPGATCVTPINGRNINCDTPAQILGSAPTPLLTAFPTQPGFWNTSLHGAYNAANTTNHYYFDGVIAKCDSPRMGLVPIVSEELDWDLGDANPGWPSGKKTVKFVGFYFVIVTDPNDSGDWQGSGSLKTASADVIWFSPTTECAGPGGSAFPWDPMNPGVAFTNVYLVDPTN